MIDVRRGAERAVGTQPGIVTRHSFAAGGRHDPANTRFGSLVAHDEHVVQPGAGFAAHRHRGLDIVTWVLHGTLLHEDPAGGRCIVRHGTFAHLAAGPGIEHAERNGGEDELRFVQMWFLGEAAEPAYRLGEPRIDGVRVRHTSGETDLPAAPHTHVYVVAGSTALGGTVLRPGDTARVSDEAVRLSGSAETLVCVLSA